MVQKNVNQYLNGSLFLNDQYMFREYIALNHPVKKNRTNLTGNRIGHND